jgi:polysaccharide export outer membrane protein
MTWSRIGTLFGLGVLVLGCTEVPAPPPPTTVGAPGGDPQATRIEPASHVNEPDVSQGDLSGYRLGPGDQIRLTTFRHEDLSGEFQLDGEGSFAMPLVGQIHASGQTARQLERRVEIALKSGDYLVDPRVSIEVLNYRPFYIIGEVRAPGSYPYVNGMTVVNAVALAGGFSYRADQNGMILSRGGANAEKSSVAADEALLPGDILEVPERFF